jgi:hypothetical protein
MGKISPLEGVLRYIYPNPDWMEKLCDAQSLDNGYRNWLVIDFTTHQVALSDLAQSSKLLYVLNGCMTPLE